MTLRILDVDLLAFERGSQSTRQAVVEGVQESLATGFVSSTHDLPNDLLDEAYGLLQSFFHLPLEIKQRFHHPHAHGQTGYTGVLVETAADEEQADWKEMLNWSRPLPADHPLKLSYPLLYPEGVLPEEAVPGITAVLRQFHDAMADVQRRFLRVVALALGADEAFFEEMVVDGPTLTRALRYPPMREAPAAGHEWAAPHADINLITVLPRATGPGLEVAIDGHWQALAPPEGRVIINAGLMLERLSNGRLPSGWHRVRCAGGPQEERFSVVQFCHPSPAPSSLPCPAVAKLQRRKGLPQSLPRMLCRMCFIASSCFSQHQASKLDDIEGSSLTTSSKRPVRQMFFLRPNKRLKRRQTIQISFLAFALPLLLASGTLYPERGKASPVGLDLNRALQIGWYSLRVQNPFGTNYTGLISIKSYNQQTQEFVFLNQQGQDVPIKASEISFIYFRQLPDRSDVNVNVGTVRNIQITPYREFLYDVPPGRLAIQEGSLLLDTRWRIAEQKPFDVNLAAPKEDEVTMEKIEIPRRIQLNYLGNRYLIETELVTMTLRSTPEASGGTVPKRLPTLFPNPAPPISP